MQRKSLHRGPTRVRAHKNVQHFCSATKAGPNKWLRQKEVDGHRGVLDPRMCSPATAPPSCAHGVARLCRARCSSHARNAQRLWRWAASRGCPSGSSAATKSHASSSRGGVGQRKGRKAFVVGLRGKDPTRSRSYVTEVRGNVRGTTRRYTPASTLSSDRVLAVNRKKETLLRRS